MPPKKRRGSPPRPPPVPASSGFSREVDAARDPEFWAPRWRTAWTPLLVLRLLGVFFLPISDCDETFNYWEPTHYLMYGRGFQTWEYSPQYALRSYAYVWFHVILGYLGGGIVGADKVAVFQMVRMLLAVLCSLVEVYLYRAVVHRFGNAVGQYTLGFLLVSAGLPLAGSAFLPSSFTMYTVALAYAAWMRRDYALAVFSGALGDILGWPFAGIVFVPLGLHMLVSRDGKGRPGWLVALLAGILSCALLLVRPVLQGGPSPSLLPSPPASLFPPSLFTQGVSWAVDSWYYGRPLLSVWHLVEYNVLGVGGGGQGSELYGVEPPSYYLRNLALNFNIVFVAAALAPICLLGAAVLRWCFGAATRDRLARRTPPLVDSLVVCAAAAGWVAFMTSRPHKEERFLFPVFTLVPVMAAVGLRSAVAVGSLLIDRISDWWGATAPADQGKDSAAIEGAGLRMTDSMVVSVFLVAAVVSASRLGALHKHYHSSMRGWTFLSKHTAATPQEALIRSPLPQDVSWNDALSNPSWDTLRGALARDGWIGPHWGIGGWNHTVVPDRAPGVEGHGKWSKEPFGLRVCVGKEWYRFPSSFFLPDATRIELGPSVDPGATPGGPLQLSFLRSDFRGELPQPFLVFTDGTSVPREGFNDENREEPDRYVPLSACDYVVDFALPQMNAESLAKEPHFRGVGALLHAHDERNQSIGRLASEAGGLLRRQAEALCAEGEWESIWREPFLHAPSSPAVTRAFFAPNTAKYNWYGTYHVLRRRQEARKSGGDRRGRDLRPPGMRGEHDEL